MIPIKLSAQQINTLHACADDLACILEEVNQARKAGVPIDPELDRSCRDCSDRLELLLNYKALKETRKVL